MIFAEMLERCIGTGILSGPCFCVLNSREEWSARASVILRGTGGGVKAILLDPFDKSISDVQLNLTVSTSKLEGSNPVMRVLASADMDAAPLMGIHVEQLRGVPLLEDLGNGDYIMVCKGLKT